MKNPGLLFGIAIICLALFFGGALFKRSLVNYVTFPEAAAATGSSVQIMGAPVSGSMTYDDTAHALHFKLDDGTGHMMPVMYKGPKPEDLQSAMSKGAKITAQGAFDPQQRQFVADNLLVKCPSKYQGGSTQRSYSRT